MDRTICFRVSDIEYAQIAKDADRANESPSGFVKQIFLRSMLGDHKAGIGRSQDRPSSDSGIGEQAKQSGRDIPSGNLAGADPAQNDSSGKSIYKRGYSVKEIARAWRSRGGFDDLEHRNLCEWCIGHSCRSVQGWIADQGIKAVLPVFCKCSGLGCRHGEIAI